MKRSGVVIFIAIALIGLTVADTFTPVMITTLFRHGSRAPVINDLNLTWAYQVGAGNLTGVGMRQHYLLGRQIKKNYPDLFDYGKFTNYDYFLRSSPTWRTIQSALSHMSGIYQSGIEMDSGFGLNITNQVKDNIEPNFSPIDFTFDQNKALPFGFGVFPVITANTNMDFLFKLDESCPNLAKIKETGRKDKVKHYEDVPSDLYSMLDKIGLKPSQFRGDDSQGWDLDSADAAADSLSADLYYSGKNYPGTSDDFYKKLFLAASIHFALNYPTDEIQRLWTDGISRAIIEGMDGKINGTISHKLRLFSGHDSNVMPFMMKYGLTNEICLKEVYQNGHTSGTCELKPSFASSFIWELVQRASDKSYFARVLFNGKPVKVCGNNVADFYCPYADFKNMMKDKLYSKTFMDTCGSLYYRLSSWRTTLIVLLVGLSLAALASLVLVFMYFKVYYRTKSEIAEAEQSYSDNKITTA